MRPQTAAIMNDGEQGVLVLGNRSKYGDEDKDEDEDEDEDESPAAR